MKKIFVLLLAMLPTIGFAGFEVVGDVPHGEMGAGRTVGVATSNVQSPGFGMVAVAYIDAQDIEIEIRRGFGRDVKLIEALKQIVPTGWHAFLKDELIGKFDKNRLVSWRGGRKWVEVLDILANDQGLSIDVDWKNRKIFVGEKKAAISEGESDRTIWTAKPDSTLRKAVQEWGQRAGWMVRWVPEDLDYPILGTLAYEGSFEQAIIGIFRAFEKAERPMLVDGNHKQKLLVITEKR